MLALWWRIHYNATVEETTLFELREEITSRNCSATTNRATARKRSASKMRIELKPGDFTQTQRIEVCDILSNFMELLLNVDHLFTLEREGTELVVTLSNNAKLDQDFIRIADETINRLEEVMC